MPGRKFWATLAAVMLAAIFVAALLPTIDYPFGAAWDERLKARGAMTGRYLYYHPLVMIDLAQGAALALGSEQLESYVQIGRVLSLLAGGVLVFGTFCLARLVLPDLPALAAAAAAAATPTVTVHARIFKEDIFLAAFLVLAFAALISLLQAPAPHRAILLGLFAGLTAGSKYVGFLFLLFAIVAIIFVPTPGPPRKPLRVATVSGVAIGTFLLVMLPAIRRIERWHQHVNFEIKHVIDGHDVSLPLRLTSGVFHLRESLLPGLGTPLLVAGIAGLAAPFVAAQERRMPLALIAMFAVLWYVVHESAPLKPLSRLFALHGAARAAACHSRHIPRVRALVTLGPVRRHRRGRRHSGGAAGALGVYADQRSRYRPARCRSSDRCFIAAHARHLIAIRLTVSKAKFSAPKRASSRRAPRSC